MAEDLQAGAWCKFPRLRRTRHLASLAAWWIALIAASALLWPTSASATVITFEEVVFADAFSPQAVTNQYAALGVTFANASALQAGITLDELEFPPHSGSIVVIDDGAPLTIHFASPVSSVLGYFTYALDSPMRLLFSAFDVHGAPVGVALSTFSSNTAISGETASMANELIGLSSLTGIAAVTIAGRPDGGSFTLDDLTFVPLRNLAVPEPPSLLLLALALAMLAVSRRPHFR